MMNPDFRSVLPRVQEGDYQILEILSRSQNCSVYRAKDLKSDQNVILKTLNIGFSNTANILRLKNEFLLLKRLGGDYVIRAYDLFRIEDRFSLVMEDTEAISLKQYLQSHSLDTHTFLQIALRIAQCIDYIHQNDVIHKDINPSNILYDPISLTLKLIDFGMGTELSLETVQAVSPDRLEGTLSYISPEQTGRMNRPIDYRTDLYSFGATLYELLAGHPPFVSNDSMELVHSHIAKTPPPLSAIRLEIPDIISDLVMKLLEKKAEDRYQSAYGVWYDLEQCLHHLEDLSQSPFMLAQHDLSGRFQIPQKLYGREPEIGLLMEAFDRIHQGSSEMVLISGYSGIGKTSLVKELYKPITAKGGLFLSGKFDQLDRSIPYSAIVDAFTEQVRELLGESESILKTWKGRLLSVLGTNGQVIIDVIPDVELIIGPQPSVPELNPSESQNRFNQVFLQFIRGFCRPSSPLILFLDDLQWADIATLNLIERIFIRKNIDNFLFIGSYRDNEVTVNHPLSISIGELLQAEAPVNCITLQPLHHIYVEQLIAETLSLNTGKVKKLADLFMEKTEGNPFFINELGKTLYHANLIWFDKENRIWQWNIDGIEAFGISDNVVDLLVRELQQLDPAIQRVLSIAACLGARFSLKTLSMVEDRPLLDVYDDLKDAMKKGYLVQRSGQDEDLMILEFGFRHDRIQQAAYSLIPIQNREETHLMIGRVIWQNSAPAEQDEMLFDIIGHLNRGKDLITASDERLRLSELNLLAGKKAKRSTAYDQARVYLQNAADLLSHDSWEEQYSYTLDVYRELADVEYLTGEFEKAEADFQKALAHAANRYDTVEIYLQIITQYNQLGRYNELVDVARTALRLFDVNLPDAHDESELQKQFARQMSEYHHLLGGRPVADLILIPDVADRDQDYIIRLMAICTDGTYIAIPTLFPYVTMEVVIRSMRYGHSSMSAIGFVWSSVVIIGKLNDYHTGYELGTLSMQLIERYPNMRIRSQVTFLYAVCVMHWMHPLSEQIEVYNKAYQYGIDNGNLVFAGYARTMIPKTVLASSTVDKALEENDISIAFYEKTGSPFLVSEQFCNIFLKNLRGQSTDPISLSTPDIDEDFYLHLWQQPDTLFGHGLAYFLNFKLQVLYIFGKYRDAWDFASAHADWMKYIPILYETTVFRFYHTLAGTAIYFESSSEERETIAASLAAAIDEFTIWAKNCPDNYAWEELLLRGEEARIANQSDDALDFYKQSGLIARTYGQYRGIALSMERAGRLHLELGKQRPAKTAIEEAGFQYYQWGAIGKVQALQKEFSLLLTEPDVEISTGGHWTSTLSTHQLDLNTVLKSSRVLSGEVQLEKLLQKIMDIVIENAGARFGYLLLPEDDDWYIVVGAGIEGEKAQSLHIPLTGSDRIGEAMVRYVIHTSKDLILDDAWTEPIFSRNSYIQEHQTHSVACIPLFSHSRMSGIVYLENDLVSGAFPPNRINVLKMITIQASISIENALLYANLEEKVRERTYELERALDQVEKEHEELLLTQEQLIKSEKMAGLVTLVSGVAHEINNPTNFLYISTTTLKQNLEQFREELLGMIDEHDTEIISYLQEWFVSFDSSLINILDGSNRIKTIVQDLRSVSRFNETEKEEFQIAEALASTIRIVKAQYQSQIDFVTAFQTGGTILGYPAQINQVLLNILINSCYAIQLRKKENQEKERGRISISLEESGNEIRVSIEDNGVGMTSEAKRKMFEPFFSTKPVGQGTGLGMYISYGVIQKHEGRIEVESEVGKGTKISLFFPVYSGGTREQK